MPLRRNVNPFRSRPSISQDRTVIESIPHASSSQLRLHPQPERCHRTKCGLGLFRLQMAMADDLEQRGFERKYRTPTAFVIDRDGIVRSRTRGAKPPFFYTEKVLPLLN